MMCLAGKLSKTSVEDIFASFPWMRKVIKRTNRQLIICSFHITVAGYSLRIGKQTNLLQEYLVVFYC